jgi:hypothetical protein
MSTQVDYYRGTVNPENRELFDNLLAQPGTKLNKRNIDTAIALASGDEGELANIYHWLAIIEQMEKQC